MARTDQPLVKAEHIVKHFPIRGGVFLRQVDRVKAVNDVSLEIREGETYGLVGESGCGKSTLGSVLLGLEQPTSGRVLFDGVDLTACSRQKRRELRRQIQVVFQDPYESLNPPMTVGEIVSEGLRIQGGCSAQERRERVLQILEQVGLSKEHYGRYPHEFSGGQRQRIGIARALIVNPRFIVCDEPVSALDVSVQAQIINLLRDLQRRHGFAYLFIAHGLNVVKYLSGRIGVMYLGQLVEEAGSDALFDHPRHPYTQALLKAIPDIDAVSGAFEQTLGGDVPSPVHLPDGCPFHPRCAHRMEICSSALAPVVSFGEEMVRCHLYSQSDAAPDGRKIP